LQYKFIDTDGDGPYEYFIEDLIVRCVFGRSDVENFPFEIVGEGLQAFKCDFKGEWGEEGCWVV